LVLPQVGQVLVVTVSGERKLREKDRIPELAGLKGLTPLVVDLLWRP
jgi:hypothetical protein